MRPEPSLSSQAIVTPLRAAAPEAPSPDTLVRFMLEEVEAKAGITLRAAYVLQDVIDPATGEVLETLAMGRSGDAGPPILDRIDPAELGVLVHAPIRALGSGLTARFTAQRPFHHDQVVHLVYDLGDAKPSAQQARKLETLSLSLTCSSMRSFGFIDDTTLRSWLSALNEIQSDEITLLKQLLAQPRMCIGSLAEQLGLSEKSVLAGIQRIANRRIASPNQTELIHYVITRYGFLRYFAQRAI